MTVYSTDVASAAVDIGAAGLPVTFIRKRTAYSGATDTWTGTPLTAASVAVRVAASGADVDRFLAQTLVITNPVMLLVAAAALNAVPYVPLPDDTVMFAGSTYIIRDTNVTAPDGTPIAYRIAVTQ